MRDLRVEAVARGAEPGPREGLGRQRVLDGRLDGPARQRADEGGHAGRLVEARLDVELTQLDRAEPRL